jgi:hypothetical protein
MVSSKGSLIKNFNTDFEKPRHIDALIRHVELAKRNVEKQPIPPARHHRPVYTAAKVSMAGFTVRGIENEISYVQRDWPIVAMKELGDNPYDFFKEFYPDSPKEHRRIAYNVWQPYPNNPSAAEYFVIRIGVTSSNVDNFQVFEDLQGVFDLTRYYSSKRGQYKGGTGELGDALKRMLKMGYASWISHSLNQGKPDLQWNEPIILTFNKKRYYVLLHVDTEIDEAKAIINQDHDAVINSTDTVVSVALPMNTDYEYQVGQLELYYKIYKVPKIRTNFSFNGGRPPPT